MYIFYYVDIIRSGIFSMSCIRILYYVDKVDSVVSLTLLKCTFKIFLCFICLRKRGMWNYYYTRFHRLYVVEKKNGCCSNNTSKKIIVIKVSVRFDYYNFLLVIFDWYNPHLYIYCCVKIQAYRLGIKKKLSRPRQIRHQKVFYLRSFTATMTLHGVPSVLPSSFAAF